MTNGQKNTIEFNDRVVRQFMLASLIWGVVGMLVGVIIGTQLNFWQANLGQAWLTKRVRTVINTPLNKSLQRASHAPLLPTVGVGPHPGPRQLLPALLYLLHPCSRLPQGEGEHPQATL